MVVEEMIETIPELGTTIQAVATILKVIGGLFGIYILILLINMISNIKRNRLLKQIIENLNEINKKLKSK
jgi:hypothetical protein